MILKLILEFRLLVGFKPTIFVYLLVIKIHQRAQFSKRRNPNDALNICLMIADGNWLDVSSQLGLLKEMESAIGFPTAQQSQRIDITYIFFKEVFHLGQINPAVLRQSWTAISSYLQPVSTSI